ncbi:MAG: hypothetical protein V8S08_04435 [Lachnoclostridium sp.]
MRNYISNAFNHVSGDMVIEVKLLGMMRKPELRYLIPECRYRRTENTEVAAYLCKSFKVDKAHTRE